MENKKDKLNMIMIVEMIPEEVLNKFLKTE